MAATTGDSSCHTPEEESDLENNSFSYYDSVGLGTKVGRLVLEIRRRRWRSNGKKSGGNRDGASLQDGEGASVAAVDPTEHLPPTPTDSNVSFGRGTGVTGATAAVAEAQQNIESYRGKNQPSEFYAAGSAISRHSKPHATENSRPTGVTCAEDLLLSEVEANSREGWRVGEGIAVPADGADAIWDRLKVLFDGRRRAENGGGVATVEIGCGRTSHGHEKGCRDVLVMGNDVEGTCGRGRGGGCDTEETGTGAKASAVAALELHNRKEAVVEAVRWAWKVRLTSQSSHPFFFFGGMGTGKG